MPEIYHGVHIYSVRIPGWHHIQKGVNLAFFMDEGTIWMNITKNVIAGETCGS